MYNETIKKALDKYRIKNPELIKAIAHKAYLKSRDKLLANCVEKQRIYRAKLKLKKLESINDPSRGLIKNESDQI
jgi:hypothetical protein